MKRDFVLDAFQPEAQSFCWGQKAPRGRNNETNEILGALPGTSSQPAAQQSGGSQLVNAALLVERALVISRNGRYLGASDGKKALAIVERTLGPEHQGAADVMDVLGGIYEAIENYAAAEPLRQKALEIRRRLGLTDLTFAESLNKSWSVLLL